MFKITIIRIINISIAVAYFASLFPSAVITSYSVQYCYINQTPPGTQVFAAYRDFAD